MTTNRPAPSACLSIEDLKEGMKVEKEYTVTEEMVQKFAEVSGDYNPLHFDAEYARTTVFRRPIAHGMISVAQFSAIFGMNLPGLGAIWMQQRVEFLAPVYIGTPHTAIATVEKVEAETNSVTILTEAFTAEGKKVLTGKGVLKPIPAKVKARMEGF